MASDELGLAELLEEACRLAPPDVHLQLTRYPGGTWRAELIWATDTRRGMGRTARDALARLVVQLREEFGPDDGP